MCDEHVEAEKQNQHSRTVLQIPIQLANHSSQPQEPNNFKSAEKAADALKRHGYSMIERDSQKIQYCGNLLHILGQAIQVLKIELEFVNMIWADRNLEHNTSIKYEFASAIA